MLAHGLKMLLKKQALRSKGLKANLHILGLLGDTHGGHDLFHAVTGYTHKIGVLGQHGQSLGLALHFIDVCDGSIDLLLQHNESLYILPAAGNSSFHAVAETFNACI